MKLFSLVAAVAVIAIACSDSMSNEELNATSDFQSAILEDDEVTSGEMEFAVVSYVDCLGELGVTTEAHLDQSQGAYTYRFTSDVVNVGEVLEGESGTSCHENFLDKVELRFADNFVPNPDTEAQLYASVAECLRVRGYPVEDSDPATLSIWVSQAPTDYDACFDEALNSQG